VVASVSANHKAIDTNHCIVGGPFGLEIALSLARQGLSFRIVGKLAALNALYTAYDIEGESF